MSEDESKRIFIIDDSRTSSDGKTIYLLALFSGDDVNIINKYELNEWYIETGYRFDSTNSYCIEIVDAKILTLETENAALRAQLTTLTPKYPWQNFYEGFDERVEYYDSVHKFTYNIRGIYESASTILQLIINKAALNTDYEYLLILSDDNGQMIFILIDTSTFEAYLNEINNSEVSPILLNGQVYYAMQFKI